MAIAIATGLLFSVGGEAEAQADAQLNIKVPSVPRAARRRGKSWRIIGIFQHGEIVMAKGYGYSNIELQAPVSPETMFQSASVGKQFTAVAVMLQVQDGKLRLDESIRTWFPDAPESWQAITVRNLLNQRPPVDLRAVTESGGGIIPQSLADVQRRTLRLALEYKFR